MSGLIDWIGQHQELLTNVLVGLMALAAAFGLGVSALNAFRSCASPGRASRGSCGFESRRGESKE